MVKNDYRKKGAVLDDEHEENDMEVSKNKEECIKAIFPQWGQEDIRFCYQEIWQKESQEYKAQEAGQRRQFEDVMLW